MHQHGNLRGPPPHQQALPRRHDALLEPVREPLVGAELRRAVELHRRAHNPDEGLPAGLQPPRQRHHLRRRDRVLRPERHVQNGPRRLRVQELDAGVVVSVGTGVISGSSATADEGPDGEYRQPRELRDHLDTFRLDLFSGVDDEAAGVAEVEADRPAQVPRHGA
jgi:hypothetical protein